MLRHQPNSLSFRRVGHVPVRNPRLRSEEDMTGPQRQVSGCLPPSCVNESEENRPGLKEIVANCLLSDGS